MKLKYEDIKVGDKASFSKTISESDVYLFAGITGDLNPIHINSEHAKQSIFKTRVAHGFLCASLISTVFGTDLPGPGTVYLSQQMDFKEPVRIGDTITAEVEVLKKRDDKKILTFKTTVSNQEDTVVIEGTAVVKMFEE